MSWHPSLDDIARHDDESGSPDRRGGAARELVRRSCAAQGIPERIEDPTILARVIGLLRQAI